MKKLKIGIVGCGAIGSEIAKACETRLKDNLKLVALYDIDLDKSRRLARSLRRHIVVGSIEALVDKVDLIVEAAHRDISRTIVQKAIQSHKAALIMSVGGLIDSEALLKKAQKKDIKIYFPSGALCGIDGLKGARISKIDKVVLTTTKPPRGLAGAPYLEKRHIDLNSIKEETVLFQGSALEAVAGFPKNVNVASILSLAGIGAKNTIVRIVASPHCTRNTHEIEIIGDFGKMKTISENIPSRHNPKTSTLAILSAIATLEGIAESVKIGT